MSIEAIVGIVLLTIVAVEVWCMWGEKGMDVTKLMTAEIELINKLMIDHGVRAGTKFERTSNVKSSFISYGLKLAPGESIKSIERVQRELSNAMTEQRASHMKGYTGKVVVRLRELPLAIEVPHPAPTPLTWHSAAMHMGPYMALIGRSYSAGAREEYIDLEKHHHVLVAAMSGGGKSTLMRMALLTLALNTTRADLQIVLIDLKNDDLTPFRALPHVINYAGDIESAADLIGYVHQVKTERIATQSKPYRLLLVIDELAELGADKDSLKRLGSILSTGRSLGINVWAGTQYPSAAAIGSVVSASFTTRLVGMVDGKISANVATKRAGSGAELLTLPGDFLRVDGPELVRMKSYHIDMDHTAMLIQQIVDKKSKSTKENVGLEPTKTEAEALAERIAELYDSGASKRSMAMQTFGKQYGGSIAAKIDAAIDVLKQRSATTATTTEGATTGATEPFTRVNNNQASSSSAKDDEKIIKMFPRKTG